MASWDEGCCRRFRERTWEQWWEEVDAVSGIHIGKVYVKNPPMNNFVTHDALIK